jgi:hypothetical protein
MRTSSQVRKGRVRLICFGLLALAGLGSSKPAHAEKVLVKVDDNWEVYTDGRVGGFLSYAHGDGFPQPTYQLDASGTAVPIRAVSGGGFVVTNEQKPIVDATHPAAQDLPGQGEVNSMRVRSGFIGNVLGFGVRGQLTPQIKVTGYLQLWAFIESEGREKNRPNYIDARQGYAKIESRWGSLLVGRTRALFSRGATDIDAQYAHRWGLGFPGSFDSSGPTNGQIGFGVLGSGFAGAIIYGTPVLAGFQLNVGIFDPIRLQGNGAWNRTRFARPEAELTFERAFGSAGKVALFANGAYQSVYKDGYCKPPAPCSETAAGVGYGGRFEYDFFHIGLAGHIGKGLGLNYALETSDAAQDLDGNMRKFDGYYAQTQFIVGKFDLSAGAGIARVFLTANDNEPEPNPADPNGPQIIRHSVIKNQIGYNAGVVYNLTPNLHFDLDFFRAEANWYFGEKQVLYIANSGMTFNW